MSKRDEFVAVAQSQVGVTEKGVNNVKYNTWYYGYECNGRPGTSEYAWCVVFESWCANEVGILNTLVPKCNNVGVLADWYKDRGLFHTSNYTPKKGDLVIFKNYAHTGIVEYVDNQVHTIEGNCGNKVARRTYDVWGKIIGYCEVKFDDEHTPVDNRPNVVYQTYDNTKEKWLGEITNYNDSNIYGYAGNFGDSVGGIKVRLSNKSKITIQSHILNGSWLSPITKWDDTSNGYSGIKGKSIDAVMIKADNYKIEYRVHLKNSHRWLGWVNGFDKNNYKNGYAGNIGEAIDAIQIRVV